MKPTFDLTMIYQVKNILYNRNLLRQFLRYAHNEQSTLKIVYPLESRKLIRVDGSEAGAFLQGLITNDVRHFEDGAMSIYAMFLNNKGRVMYDTLLYKCGSEESFLLECDKRIITQLQRHLKLFKLKRKIEITDASDNYKVWAVVAPSNTVPESNYSEANINIYKDPRVPELGYRILSPPSVNENEISNIIGNNVKIENSEKGYRCLRYKLGVSEGADELPPGTSFPLEVNCDYLHGVSFHKGCYIGQELTARIYHTGVVRKRIMPLKFTEHVENLELDSVISDSDKPKSNVGKLKGYANNFGIGLVRIKEAMEAKSLLIGKYSVEVSKPHWWPIEASKEKSSLNKVE